MKPAYPLSSCLAMFSFVSKSCDGLSDAQLLKTPPGLRNNILWNMGHLIVDNSDMLYRPAGLEPPHPESFTPRFAAGTSPGEWPEPPSPAAVKSVFADLPRRLKDDVASGRFQSFKATAVVSGWPVNDFDETLVYVAVHTGIHLGVIMTLRRLVS